MRRKALFMTLSDKVKENGFVVVDNLALPEIKTKDFFAILKKLPMKGLKGISSTLVVLTAKNENINKSARNIKKVKTILADSLNVYDILKYNFLLIDKEGVKKISHTYNK
jgi:large subunit ribosomal protein L4